MPLYACILEQQNMTINAIVFGQVRYQDCTFKGISEVAKSLPGVNKSFDTHNYETEAKSISDQVPIWRNELNKLITDYAEGYASVAPKDEKTCNFCDLKGLCRIGEISERP